MYYGTPGCALCTRDSRCNMCKYAESKGKTPEALITTGAAWMDEEAAEPWGGREGELRQLVRYGMLDQVADPEASTSAARIENGGGSVEGGTPSDAASLVVADVGYGSEAQGGGQPDEEEMTDAGQDVVINNEDDYIDIGGGSCGESTERMDSEWAMVLRPDGPRC